MWQCPGAYNLGALYGPCRSPADGLCIAYFAWPRSIAPRQQARAKPVKTALACIVQDREMRKYTIASPGFRQARAQGVTATYLEEGDEDEFEDEGLTPSERARSSLIRPQADAAAEVSWVGAGLCA